jgi:MinD superfamily P-loop ATPase
MKQLVVISGKGGTGKTSIVASFATLAQSTVLADCDVDAADLHLILQPQSTSSGEYSGGNRAHVISDRCTGCGKCEQLCRFGSIVPDTASSIENRNTYKVNPLACEGCGVCAHFCPADAIEMEPARTGTWFVSETRAGTMVHARLEIAAENSGKLVNLVRGKAVELAKENNYELVLIDGSPGLGCPVIASITGADMLLIVTEPTLSGIHDLERIQRLAAHFRVPTVVCINKADLNPLLTARIEEQVAALDLTVVGKIPYDPVVTEAQIRGMSVVEFTDDKVGLRIRDMWQVLRQKLQIEVFSA